MSDTIQTRLILGLRRFMFCHISPLKEVQCLCVCHLFTVLCEKVKQQIKDGMFLKHLCMCHSFRHVAGLGVYSLRIELVADSCKNSVAPLRQ